MIYPDSGKKPKILTIDLSGSCNLRCPSCPVGSIGQIHPANLMDKQVFKQIIQKAKREHGIRIVALHNWTEPFLHPELPELIRIVKDQGLVCSISSNLTIRRNLEEVLQATPDFFRISLSGFYQDSYQTTHVRGNIEDVKMNMRIVSEELKRIGKNKIRVTVFYHKYMHNIDEMKQMRDYATKLGFEWEETWAYYMSLEKVQQLLKNELSIEEKEFVEKRFALPIREAIVAAEKIMGHNRCSLLEDQIVLDSNGNVNLCCAVYDYSKNRLGNFLQMNDTALKQAKSNHPTCGTCTKNNLHLYFTYYEIANLKKEYERLAQSKLSTVSSQNHLPS